jgi:Phosphatidylinositol-glycan biosynthesis class S protein
MPPPPPTPAQTVARRNVIFAFWVRLLSVKLIAGRHLSRHSTLVENNQHLPSKAASRTHGRMVRWKSTSLYTKLTKACKIEFPIPVAVKNFDSSFDLAALIRNAQHHIDDANDFNAHHLRLHDANDNVEFAYTVILTPSSIPSTTATLFHKNRTLSIMYPPPQYLGLPDYLARTILTLFASEKRYIRSVLDRSLSDHGSLPEFARRVVRASRNYQVTFSLLNGGGQNAVESWDIADALQSIFFTSNY